MESVCVLCPTRGRPEPFMRLVESLKTTGSDFRLLAYVDDDDAGYAMPLPAEVSIVRGPRVGTVAAINRLIREHPGHRVYGLLTDDCRVTTPGWDQYAVETIEGSLGGIGVLSPAHNFGQHVDMPFVSRRWIDTVGWYALPDLFYWCWPTATAMLAEPIGLIRADPACFYLHHDELGPSHMDWIVDDAQKFYWWLLFHRDEVVQRLRLTALASS